MFESSLRFEMNGPVSSATLLRLPDLVPVKIRSQTDQKLFRFARSVALPDTGTEISE
jgi:hypothetical protein